jgi:5-methylcytosine-specific restriction enzyme A
VATFMLTWNPDDTPIDNDDYDLLVDRTEAGLTVSGQDWGVGNRRGGISPGDRGFLLRQHRDRGIVASGWFTSAVFQQRHWRLPDRQANYASLEWEQWLPVGDQLGVQELARHVPQVDWDHLQASGIILAPEAADRLEARWEAHLGALGRTRTLLGDEVPPTGRFVEGASTKVLVNRYERDPRARRACLAHWGWDCAVCGFNFAHVYGAIGERFMHVHHLRDLASLGGDYEIDPVQDLRPVCPNCHAMLHQRRPALPIAELQEQLRKRDPSGKEVGW